MQRAFPRLKGHFVHGAVRNNLKTQTIFRVPTHDSIHVQTPWTGVLACGDWIGYDTPAMWMERSVVTAIAAANVVLEANGAEPVPIIAPRPPEFLVRILGALIRGLRRVFGPVIVRGWRLLRRSRQ